MLADLALNRMSFRRDQAARLLDRRPLADSADLQELIRQLIPLEGLGAVGDHPDGGQILTLTAKGRNTLAVRDSEVRGAFDHAQALAREELAFLTPGHPVIAKAVELAKALEPGGTCGRLSNQDPNGLWVEVVFRITATGGRPTGQLVRHRVGRDGTVHAEYDWRLDFDCQPMPDLAIPEWIQSGLDASERQQEAELRQARDRLTAVFEQDRSDWISRRRRIFRQDKKRLVDDIQRQESWLTDNRGSESPKVARILPAREGKLLKSYEALRRLEGDLEEEVAEKEREQLVVFTEELWRGLVQGTA